MLGLLLLVAALCPVLADWNDCTFEVDDKVYQLGPLIGVSTNGTDAEVSTYKYEVSLCGNNTSPCADIMIGSADFGAVYQFGGEPGGKEVCWDILAYWEDGSGRSLEARGLPSDKGTDGFQLYIANGDLCKSAPRETTINVICDESYNPPNAGVVGVQDSTDSCHFIIDYHTICGCAGHCTNGPVPPHPTPKPTHSGSGSGSGGDYIAWLPMTRRNQWGACGSYMPDLMESVTMRLEEGLGFILLAGEVGPLAPLNETEVIGMGSLAFSIDGDDNEDDAWISISFSGGCLDGPNWASNPCECTLYPFTPDSTGNSDEMSMWFNCKVQGPTGASAVCNAQYKVFAPPSALRARTSRRSPPPSYW